MKMKFKATKRILSFSRCVSLLLLLFAVGAQAQVVNGYAQITNITSSTLKVAAVDESADSFEDGEFVIIIQMQDNVLGDSSNTSSFGDMGASIAAGVYEIREIVSHTESGGVVTTITVSGSLSNSYSTNSHARAQVVTFPEFGSPDYVTTSTMSAADWDGDIGGILAFQVSGVLTLAHSLNADEAGFRGGARDLSSSGSCDVTTFRSANTSAFASKGEGIYRVTNTLYETAKGKILNGGGGGNEHNGGGGGGGGYTAGGDAGPGYNCGGGSAGGIGGLALSSLINNGRIFLGGGGGGGEGNNSVSTDGGDGGGIILVRADEIRTSGACGGINITARGESIADAGNDGGGGGGAGGTIVIQVNSWDIDASCPITVASNGGDGGLVGSGATHGGGGGGGQGAVIYSIAQPTSNTTTNTLNGNGGCNNNSNPCNSLASSGAGGNNVGILDNQSGPLPIELLSFSAFLIDGYVDIKWTTATETNNDYFVLERSAEDGEFKQLVTIAGAGNSQDQLDYEFSDFEPLSGISYYRLKQVDFDGDFSYSHVEVIGGERESQIRIFPNPGSAGEAMWLDVEGKLPANSYLKIISATGQVMTNEALLASSEGVISISEFTANLPQGCYLAMLFKGRETVSMPFIIQ